MQAEKIKKCINSLRSKGQTVNPDNVVRESLFHAGGTLSESDKPEICEVMDGIREIIRKRVERKCKGVESQGLGLGFLVAVETNHFFNYKN